MINQQPYPPPQGMNYPGPPPYPPSGPPPYPPPQGANYPPPQGANYPPPQGANFSPPPPYSPGPNYPPPAPPIITQQPGAPGFANNNNNLMPVAGCPPGLEVLAAIDRIRITQPTDVLKAVGCCEKEIRYQILNGAGQQIYVANEESDCLERNICTNNRGFKIHIMDNTGKPVILVTRNFHIATSVPIPHFSTLQLYFHCCSCCQQQATIEMPPGNILATVRQTCCPKFTIKGANKEKIFTLKGPNLKMIYCCREQVYEVFAGADKTGGTISKYWGGGVKEFFTTTDDFGLSFPAQMPITHRAMLLGSTFFIDFIHFEDVRCTIQGCAVKHCKP